jgi:ubiquitin carboxyl-terminal hydrolase 7
MDQVSCTDTCFAFACLKTFQQTDLDRLQIDSDLAMDADYNEKEAEQEEVAIISPDESMDDATPEDILRADDFEAIKKALLPEMPDVEVEVETTFTWTIENWRQLGPREHGPVFQCGSDPWRILFFPRGNNVDHASFYLEHGWEDNKQAPEDWYACVQFMLVLWNPNDPTHYHAHNAHHRFTVDEGDWGFTRFCELRKLFGQSEEHPRPLVENDTAKLTAFVRKMKDPTGVLWHNFVG